ncbi:MULTISPECIES: V-type ATP synthase subunit D [Anaerococcus]|uniref:V-type ATP synthase subunit D n=1 Tax=Anaerococcus TaxID=165779 RepID=UPI0008A53A24|nr:MULTISPECIES: V-type ATP synthase subunit D [Anaerococcus]MBS4889818.1 V-type ATP synthase subunit D [Anaerococcus vaginalis]MDU4446443.1 V-type ATP synthase subunit D [Anaerococcus vaginalis]MDU5086644.1 V-type ATP synthase subunit D [Anaerococcus vaginalis]MDU5252125.1 V-type ATP synthase subunit D [Anaerococcus vaginalis]MDU5460165.1 V-type ATP synthase subunit D [Anaerococcus vaginalis]
MTRLNVTPTRMNLNTLKKRLATSKRGYKLLKDKQDELMRQFLEKIRENKRLREEVEADLKDSSKGFLMASSFMSPEFLEEAVSFPTQKIGVDIKVKNVMSVRIPQMEFKIDKGGNENASMYPYGLAQTSADLDLAIKGLNKVMDKLLTLAELEKSTQLMADEIEGTRRRVNALEYRTIPDLEETIKYIRAKLEENERATISRLMKVKDIISEA